MILKMTIAGALSALLVDLKEYYDWRKRNAGTTYDWKIALTRVGIGATTGLMLDLGITGVGL